MPISSIRWQPDPTWCLPMPIRCLSDAYPMTIRCLSDAYLMPIRCLYDAYRLSLSIRWLSDGYPMPIRCLSDAYPMPIRCLSDAYPLPIVYLAEANLITTRFLPYAICKSLRYWERSSSSRGQVNMIWYFAFAIYMIIQCLLCIIWNCRTLEGREYF